MTGQTIWREGARIRRTDGVGYSDRVSDDEISGHIRSHDDDSDPLFVAFAEAVLAIRAFEREAARAQSHRPPSAGASS